MKDKADAVKCLYRQRDKFILIGLTGRTGAGCTTVAKILSTDNINELDLKDSKTCDFKHSDERKYSIVYRFMAEDERWKKFTVIEASSIIFSFILEGTYKNLFNYIDKISNEVEIKEKEELKKNIVEVLSEEKVENIKKIENEVIDKQLADWIKSLNNNPKYVESLKKENLEQLNKMIKYFTVNIVTAKNKFKSTLDTITVQEKSKNSKSQDTNLYNLYSYFMQSVGNNIRSSGEYYNNSEVIGKEITLVERINDIVKMINRLEELENEDKERTRICIDALRNSFEIQYFRDRYRAFYSFAINTEDEYRQNRLGLNRKELISLDKIEYPDNNDIFYHQNISACLENSDVYLYNPNVENHKYYELTEQIVKYISLILQPGLITPTHVERCMQLAFNAKYNSGCLSRQVGAVVTGEDFSIRSVGWNDVPKGQVSCNLRCVEDYCKNKDEETFSEYELEDEYFSEIMNEINQSLKEKDIQEKKAGKCFSYCFKDIYTGWTGEKNQVHTRALHVKKMLFCRLLNMEGLRFKEENYLQQQVLVNYVQKKHIS